VQDLRVELRLALELDEAHRRPRRGFGDRLGIPLVVLLRLHVGLHVLGRHQPHIMTLLTQDTAEMGGRRSRLPSPSRRPAAFRRDGRRFPA
jgi:hypothetical protein